MNDGGRPKNDPVSWSNPAARRTFCGALTPAIPEVDVKALDDAVDDDDDDDENMRENMSASMDAVAVLRSTAPAVTHQ